MDTPELETDYIFFVCDTDRQNSIITYFLIFTCLISISVLDCRMPGRKSFCQIIAGIGLATFE